MWKEIERIDGRRGRMSQARYWSQRISEGNVSTQSAFSQQKSTENLLHQTRPQRHCPWSPRIENKTRNHTARWTALHSISCCSQDTHLHPGNKRWMWEGAFIDDVFLWGHPVPHLSWLWLTLVPLLFFPPLFIMPLLPLPSIFYHSSLFLQTFPNIHLPLAPGSFRSFAKMFSFIIHLWTQVLVKRGRKETKKRDMSYFLKFRLLKLRLGAKKKKITIKIILQYFLKFLKRVFFHSFVSLTLQEFSILCSLPVFRLPWWLRW